MEQVSRALLRAISDRVLQQDVDTLLDNPALTFSLAELQAVEAFGSPNEFKRAADEIAELSVQFTGPESHVSARIFEAVSMSLSSGSATFRLTPEGVRALRDIPPETLAANLATD